MRAVDDNTPVKLAVLRKLREWGPLTESDLGRMLAGHFITTDDLRDMEEEGLVDMAFVGDEHVVTTAIVGRLFLEQHEDGDPRARPDR